MDIKNNTGLLESLFGRPQNAAQQNHATKPEASQKKPDVRSGAQIDVVNVSPNTPPPKNNNASKLVSETTQDIENGFRRIQEFETPKGSKFTRVEEVTTEEDRSRRIVIQQNESGSTTILENVLDRQDDGTFRQTQRFTNEAGETDTNIEFNIGATRGNEAFSSAPDADSKPRSPFEPLRGTQYDVQV